MRCLRTLHPSHIRVGTFQFFAARGQQDKVRQLADYAIERHYPELADVSEKYVEFLKAVIERQSRLVANWMSVGFIHGVMNTDNMTISGETIDYGPCAFMDVYKADTVFSSIDELGRYAYNMQPAILQWNLARLAECLLPLIDASDKDNAVRIATNELNRVPDHYGKFWRKLMGAKIGLKEVQNSDGELLDSLLNVMEEGKADFTITFRKLSGVLNGDDGPFLEQFADPQNAIVWLEKWASRLGKDKIGPGERIQAMESVNPLYIPRNHLVEEALEAAVSSNDFGPFKALADVLKEPYRAKPRRRKI